MAHTAYDPTGQAPPRWTHQSVSKLIDLAREGASAEAISLKLALPAADVRSKASELGLSLKLNG